MDETAHFANDSCDCQTVLTKLAGTPLQISHSCFSSTDNVRRLILRDRDKHISSHVAVRQKLVNFRMNIAQRKRAYALVFAESFT